MYDHRECHLQGWVHQVQVDLASKVHRVCTVHRWVLDRDRTILYLGILTKVHHLLVISRGHGMGQDLMVHLDHQEVQVDLVVHLNKDHQDQVLVNIGLQECNFMVVRLVHLVKDLHVVHLDILVDLQVIQEVLNHVPNGIDHQECITGLRDHQVSLNINICKARNLVKAHHREDLLQVLWVVQEVLHLVMVAHLKDHHKDPQEDLHHM